MLPPGARRAAVAHQLDHLVGRLWRQRPEVPLHVVAAHAAVRQRYCEWMKSGNFIGSRTKKTGVLLPTMS